MSALLCLEVSGAVAGVLGAAMVASNTKASAYGFHVYLVSNACMIAFSILARHWGLLAMNVVFMATSVLGIWRWSWREPDARGIPPGPDLTPR